MFKDTWKSALTNSGILALVIHVMLLGYLGWPWVGVIKNLLIYASIYILSFVAWGSIAIFIQQIGVFKEQDVAGKIWMIIWLLIILAYAVPRILREFQ